MPRYRSRTTTRRANGRVSSPSQMHSGPPFTVRYTIVKFVHDPDVKLAGLDEAAFNAKLRPAYPGK